MAVFVLRCFGSCTSFLLQQDSFVLCIDEELMYFEDGSVGLQVQAPEETGDIDGSDEMQFELMNCPVNLRSGAYQMKVCYNSLSGSDSANIDQYAGRIVFHTENGAVLRASDLLLRDGIFETETRLWLRPGSGTSEVRISVWHHGKGRLSVKSIQIEEKREYRVILCVVLAVFFASCHLLYWLFIRPDSSVICERRRIVAVGILGITFFCSLPYFADFLKHGHDLRFHLSRIVSLAEALEEGQIPNRMQFGMLNGYGYATPLYYGEIFLLLPAVLYCFYVPLQVCFQIFVTTVNFFTSLVSYWCFGKMSGDWKKGLLGALLYTLSAYRMTNIMLRAAVGEYTALLFFPLLLYGFWNIYTKQKQEVICIEDILPIVFAAAGIINSHILSCEMIIVFVGLFLLAAFRRTFQKNICAALLKSGLLSILLNLWFIVPFVQSMKMPVNITDHSQITKIEGNGVYLAQLFGIFHPAGGANSFRGTKGEMPLALGLPLVLGICLYLFLFLKKDRWQLSGDKKMKAAGWCMVFGMIAVFLTSVCCWWDNFIYVSDWLAQLVGMVQFPWRYLGIAVVFFIVMVIYLLQVLGHHGGRRMGQAAMAVFVAAAVLTEGHFMMEYMNAQDELQVYTEADLDTMNVAGAEYLLQNTNLEGYRKRDILCQDGIRDAGFSYDKKGIFYLDCINSSSQISFVDVPVQAYENYYAYRSDGREVAVTCGENNRIRIEVPGNFAGRICLKYRVPLLWRMCEMISCLTALWIFGIWLLKRKRKRDTK